MIRIYPSGNVSVVKDLKGAEKENVGALIVDSRLINKPKCVYFDWINFVQSHYAKICEIGDFNLTMFELEKMIKD